MITVESPPTRDYLSYSAVRTFQMCSLKYRFRYIDGLPEELVSSSLVFGSAIHAALEFFFSQQLAGEELPDRDMLLSVYKTNWQNRAEANVQFGKKETADSLHELAGRMLKAFLESDLTRWRRNPQRILARIHFAGRMLWSKRSRSVAAAGETGAA